MRKRIKKVEFLINENNCFICTSHAKDKDGYVRYGKDKKNTKMHRHIYEECFGEIPKGMLIRHKCDNPACINPEHLELGTNRDNKDDMIKRNRVLKNENHPNVKLTWVDIYKIRDLYKSGKTQKELAKMYNVSPRNINKIVNNETWKEIGD